MEPRRLISPSRALPLALGAALLAIAPASHGAPTPSPPSEKRAEEKRAEHAFREEQKAVDRKDVDIDDPCSALDKASDLNFCRTTRKLSSVAGDMKAACLDVPAASGPAREGAIAKHKAAWAALWKPLVEATIKEDRRARAQEIEDARAEVQAKGKKYDELTKAGATAGPVEKQKIEAEMAAITATMKELEADIKSKEEARANYPATPGAIATATEKALDTITAGIAKAYYGDGAEAGLCAELCQPGVPPVASSPVYACRFAALDQSSAAVIADEDAVTALIAYMQKKLAIQDIDLGGGRTRAVADLAGVETNRRAHMALLSYEPIDRSMDASAIESVTLRTADVALTALAKVIVDRAKREGVGFFLQTMNETVCGEQKEAPKPVLIDCKETCAKEDGAQCKQCTKEEDAANLASKKAIAPDQQKWRALAEMRRQWLPHLCTLSGSDRAKQATSQYDGGAELMHALRGAVEADVKRWPGVAAGLGVAALFWEDLGANKPKDVPSLLACHDAEHTGDACAAAWRLRGAAEKMTGDLLAGSNAALALSELGTSIDALNVFVIPDKDPTKPPVSTGFYSNKFQAAACAASLPAVFQQYGDVVRAMVPGQVEQAQALLVGALTHAPACADITVKGFRKNECGAFSEAGSPTTACNRNVPNKPDAELVSALAAGQGASIERLTTVGRWSNAAGSAASGVLTQWTVVKGAWQSYSDAIKKLKDDNGAAPINIPTFNAGPISDGKTAADLTHAYEEYVKNVIRALQESKQVKALQASSALAHASVDLGVAFAEAGQRITEPTLFPGICEPGGCGSLKPLEDGRKALVALSQKLDTVDAALNNDWGQVVPRVIATIQNELTAQCHKDPQCQRITASLSRYAGFFTALATDPDPDHVARALDAAAAPIGGWRAKAIPGATSFTISAFPGFNIYGGELRWGPYGVRYERGGELHSVAPTLALPVGVDISFTQHVKFFVSVLDPAAYLQYDIEKSGRLPGAQLLTALAPGLTLRVSPWESPFSINGYAVFRPALRAWEPAVSGPAANAFQFGASVSVDVTLFDIYTKDADIEVSQ